MTARILLPLLLIGTPLRAQQPPIGIIDLFGLTVTRPEAVRAALGLQVGDSVPASGEASIHRLESLPGVQSATLNSVCCEDGKTIIYAGIVEDGSRPITWNPTPSGADRLPDSIRAMGTAFQDSLWAALSHGDAAEDRSAGHALMHYPGARQIQERFPAIAGSSLGLLRTVLHSSASAEDRAVAAQILAYTSDKQAVVPDLVAASRDPAEPVRNNAIRALFVMASGDSVTVKVPPEPFVALLQSPVWTDRNKSSLALMELTESRDPELMAALRPARPALVEMAHWKSPGHAIPALIILGRLAGLSEQELGEAWKGGDRERIIRASQ
ncbi:MAG: hypothetical protein ABI836_05380 [Gemmatimonadota bacterium]